MLPMDINAKDVLKVIKNNSINEDFAIESLARELLSKPDNFLTATFDGREYIIEDYRRTTTHANIDDGVMHWTLNLRDGGQGNIKR
jgi:hypothetical protein